LVNVVSQRIAELERQLDDFDCLTRTEALDALCNMVVSGDIQLPEPVSAVNLHFHTFYSYNACGYSPSKIAWLARKAGLAVAGIVDFDVLDGLEEFLEAGRLLGLKVCVGLETRVYVPEFADRVISSPGEPGISYHMGIGFPRGQYDGDVGRFLAELKATAQKRNRALVARVNKYLSPVELDYERDVLPLTPSGNPTERHITLAFAHKARRVFADSQELMRFWVEKLGSEAASVELPQSTALLNLIRAKTMKRGGAGYAQPDAGSFPEMAEMNRFVLAAGAIPTLTWLDGTSDGEQQIDNLLEVAMSTGVAAINIIPNRNYTAGLGKADARYSNLCDVVELAESLGLPVVVGTEMNSPGQKFVDDFRSEELSALLPVFLKGAHIVYAHSVLQRKCGLGYTSDWAKAAFDTVRQKNDFFEQLGRSLKPNREDSLEGLNAGATPEEVLSKAGALPGQGGKN